jgi:hypothetical protein
MNNQFTDNAKTILLPAQMGDVQRADAWDAYQDSSDHADLDSRLHVLGVPPAVHTALVAAKKAEMPEPTTLDRAVEALNKLKEIPRDTLALAEQHGSITKHLVDDATKN